MCGVDVSGAHEEYAECGFDARGRLGVVVLSGFDDDGDEARFGEEVAECALDFLDEAEDEREGESGCEATVAEGVGEDDEGRAVG